MNCSCCVFTSGGKRDYFYWFVVLQKRNLVFQKFKVSLFKWKQTKNQTVPVNEELKQAIKILNESHKAGKNIIKGYHLLNSFPTLLKWNISFMDIVCIPWKITCWNPCDGIRCWRPWEVISVLIRVMRGLFSLSLPFVCENIMRSW